jgi:hypothetical protein
MTLPPIFPASFYKLLKEGAEKLGVSRATFATRAARHYLKVIEAKRAPIMKALGNEDLAKQYGKMQGTISKKWWSTLSEEEKKERARKAAQARWGKKQEGEPPAE